MSAWVTVWLAVQSIEPPGASGDPLAGVQPRPVDVRVGDGHVASVVLPSLVATIV